MTLRRPKNPPRAASGQDSDSSLCGADVCVGRKTLCSSKRRGRAAVKLGELWLRPYNKSECINTERIYGGPFRTRNVGRVHVVMFNMGHILLA